MTESAYLSFDEGLMRKGFFLEGTVWVGSIQHGDATTQLEISVSDRFPFRPPTVRPIDPEALPWSWHRERDGRLCLVAQDDHDGMWWKDGEAFVDHIRNWLLKSDDHWVGDRTDLDLERYFAPAQDKRLYLYADPAEIRSEYVRFVPGSNDTVMMKGSGRGSKKGSTAKTLYGLTVNVGEILVPPRNWDDLAKLIPDSKHVRGLIVAKEIAVLVVSYRRGNHSAVLFLEVWEAKGGSIVARGLQSASTSTSARTRRAGATFSELQNRSVAIIGVGAIGSFAADALARAGIGHLTLIDEDILKPGNTIRHLAGPRYVGLPKVEAVKQVIVAAGTMTADRIETVRQSIRTGVEVMDLLNEVDLIVNATADFSITALLKAIAKSSSATVLSSAIQNRGRTIRIDVLPPLEQGPVLPSSHVEDDGDVLEDEFFEAGCGSPVSPTAPYTAIEAAAATARHAVGILLGAPINPSGEVRQAGNGVNL
ncbi:ThiF family adenylyltransferase [Salinibacterium sp. M195]|uniref:ThiF family adenylyltransferase n=1 Tax=Salinibacterium sp. M195 TaxID=2583374 RepID=UPI001C62FAC1|nr:ThiF family adenylyltransferase [Salinibacterium sp. M195]QYH36944.1 ThiF family adenylyltransferase [Salinibacterium sp. M195]